RHPVELGEEVDLHRGEALEKDVCLDALEAAKKLLVVRKWKIRMQAIDDMDLRKRVVHPDLELAPGLFMRHGAGARVALLQLGEEAEETGSHADVGHLEAHVAIEVSAIPMSPDAVG